MYDFDLLVIDLFAEQSKKRRAEAPKLSYHLLNSCVETRLEDRPTFRTVILIFKRYALEHE